MSNDPGLERGPKRFRLSNLTSAQQFWVPLAIVLVLALAGGAIAAVAGDQDVLPVAGESDDDGDVVAPAEEAAPDPATVFDDPGKYLGQELTLSVVVEKVVDPNMFRVASEDPNDPSLLVVYSGVPVVKEQALIKASGTITRFNAADVNKALGAQLPIATFDLTDDDFALVASSVEVILGAGGGGGRGTDTAATTTGTTAVALAPPAPAYAPSAPAYVPPASSGTSTGTSSERSTPSGGGSQGPSSGGSNGGSTGSEPSGGSGGGTNEPSGGTNGGPAATRNDLTFTERSASSGQYSDTTYLEALFTDEEGTPIEGARLTFVLDMTEYTTRTNEDGIASTSPTLSFEPGTYQVEVRWTRGGKTRARDKDQFEVLQDDSVLQVSLEGNGNNATLTARLTDGDSESAGLSGRTVNFYAENGDSLGSAVTDSSGVARLEVPERYKEKKDDFTATFEGDDYYLTSSDTSGRG